jgi:hypothetical protein
MSILWTLHHKTFHHLAPTGLEIRTQKGFVLVISIPTVSRHPMSSASVCSLVNGKDLVPGFSPSAKNTIVMTTAGWVAMLSQGSGACMWLISGMTELAS